MRSVPAAEFCRNFGRYQHEGQRETVAVTSHGRTTGYFLSAAEYEELRARAAGGAAPPRGRAAGGRVEAIRASSMDPRHDHLDALMED